MLAPRHCWSKLVAPPSLIGINVIFQKKIWLSCHLWGYCVQMEGLEHTSRGIQFGLDEAMCSYNRIITLISFTNMIHLWVVYLSQVHITCAYRLVLFMLLVQSVSTILNAIHQSTGTKQKIYCMDRYHLSNLITKTVWYSIFL